ncbi:MAG TPA: hypothetical protein VKN64_07970 [Halanaerobiales bacterium]|nr:hypothetical protein [Halanaerobiales bacterium]
MLWLNNLAYTYIGNYPVIMYLGIITYLLLLVTAAIPRTNRKGWTRIPIKYHIRLAYITGVLATIHGLMAISGYIG